MKKSVLIPLFLCSVLILGCKSQVQKTVYQSKKTIDSTQVELKQLISEAPWKTTNVSEGIVWKYYQFNDIFGSRQSITIFDIDMNKNIELDIPYVAQGKGFVKTSEAGQTSDADVAINGSYFDTKIGGSTHYFKSKGVIIKGDSSIKFDYRNDSAFIIDKNGKPKIVKKPLGGWDKISAPFVLAAGPLLVYKAKKVNQIQEKFNTNRHPRTAIGITKNKHLIMLVDDGRSAQSYGSTTSELSCLMLALGCVAAMNMDGGGSSTAWVKGQGVVSFPSDNKKFDHEGERGVVTVITARAK